MDSIGLIMALIKSMSHGVGKDGKSAYAYAVEGGYTGTEAEFAAKLAAEIPVVDATLTKTGQAADAKATGDAISKLSEEIANLPSGGTGLTSAEKTAMLTLFKAAAYTADVSGTITSLETLWGGGGESGGGDSGGDTGGGDSGGDTGTTYTVTNNLTNVTNSNSDTTASGFYSATLTVVDGYSMNSVVITMGGVDITDSVYGDGGILITEVTGDIVITAVAGVALAYALPEPLTFAGTGNAAYDTGYAMYPDGDKDVSICVDFSVENGPYSNVDVIRSGVTYGFRLWHNGAKIFRVNAYQNDAVTDISIPCENARLVWTIAKGKKVHYAYALKNDAVTQYTGSGYDNSLTASTATTKIGTTETAFKGTIHDFRVYDQVLSAGQIEAYLRGGTI